MEVYLVFEKGCSIPEVCLNRGTAEILAGKWGTDLVEVETVDDYKI